MTELLYFADTYLKEFDAAVTAVDAENNGVVLDRTAFFPGGGGQPADSGRLEAGGETYTVRRARKIDGEIVHLIDQNQPLPEAGTAVHGVLDWEPRYQLMRTHTAMHILCGVVWRDYSAHATGSNMEPLKGRLDFEFETLEAELVAEIEEKFNAEVANAREVRNEILPREEAFKIPDLIRTKINLLPEGIQEVRITEIVGLDLQADGGTHVRNTAEVGRVRITDYKSKGRINKRIYFELAEE
jgi:misacylated tRNA(Ala) deacylase